MRKEEESGAGVSDGGANVAAGRVAAATSAVGACGELPEALRVIDGDVGDAARVLGGIDVAA